MDPFAAMAGGGHEQVVLCHDAEAGYRGVIAIHSTVLGPAAGGTRMLRYASAGDALADALRLSRAMTYKNAAADLPFGGGKAVILGGVLGSAGEPDRERLFRAHGRFVHRIGGLFLTAEDVGTNEGDLEVIRRETPYVRPAASPAGGRSATWTARGVLRAMAAAARERWGSDELAGRTVAVQGCGQVGREVARLLAAAGARLVVADVDPAAVRAVVRELGARAVTPEAIYDERADIFAPCALGAVIDNESVGRLGVEIVAGAANNQLAEDRHGDLLAARGILYAPDFVANAGGVISGAGSLLGWERSRVAARIDAIYNTMQEVFERARREQIPTWLAANRLAEGRLQAGRGGGKGGGAAGDELERVRPAGAGAPGANASGLE